MKNVHERAIESAEQAFNQEFNYVEEKLTQDDNFILGPRTPQDVADLCPTLQQHFGEDR